MIASEDLGQALREAARRVRRDCCSWVVYADADGFGFLAMRRPRKWQGREAVRGFYRVNTHGEIVAHMGRETLLVGRWTPAGVTLAA